MVTTPMSRSSGRRRGAALAAVALLAAAIATLAMGPVSPAKATLFCGGVTLGPNGQCHSPKSEAGDLNILSSYSPDRANCVALLGYNGEQLDSWVCAAKGASPWYVTSPSRPFGYYRAAVKNNNMSQSGTFNGYYYCCR